jgi:hypothetical protein
VGEDQQVAVCVDRDAAELLAPVSEISGSRVCYDGEHAEALRHERPVKASGSVDADGAVCVLGTAGHGAGKHITDGDSSTAR